ncbi:MAG: rubrerythrin [Thermoguttaceae bacterium]
MELKNSRTERNLVAAFVGESAARNRYTYFSSQARNDGFIQISQIFEETANQEKEHAKRFFKFLEGGSVTIESAFPAGVIGPTADNLLAAAAGEHEEWSILYPQFAAIAREEGFKTIAVVFERVAVAERQHERRYRGLLENIQAGRVFQRDQPVRWRCLNCGYVHEGPEAPAACPACAHPQAYFEVLAENWL